MSAYFSEFDLTVTSEAVAHAADLVESQIHRGGKLAFGPRLEGGEWYSEHSWPTSEVVVVLDYRAYNAFGAEGLVLTALEEVAAVREP